MQADHMYLLVMVAPKPSISGYVGAVKGRTAIRIFDRFRKMKRKAYWGNHFWVVGTETPMFLNFQESIAGLRIKGDERILGDSDFVEKVLKSAGEELEEKCVLKARGYDFNRVISRLGESMGMIPREVAAFGN